MMLTIPSRGLDEIRRSWTGRGGLWAGVAASHDEDGVPWTPVLARRRASRIILELIRPTLEAWPGSHRAWIDSLPAQSVRRRSADDVPGPGIDWAETRRSGWPPRVFHHRHRSRIADSLLMTTTKWTIERLAAVVSQVDKIDAELLGELARSRLEVAVDVLDMAPMAPAGAVVPGRNDLRALRSAGRPWRAVASVAATLLQLEHDPASIADLALDPDPALADRLFHVAVLGCLLVDLRARGWTIDVVGLPGSPDGHPQFMATSPEGEPWDVWFEMAAAWRHYGVTAPYPSAVVGVSGTGGPLGADIALVRKGDRAVVIECKYSANPTYVGRGGYEQTLAYMAEARTGMVGAVSGIVVGPEDVVLESGRTATSAGDVSVTHPESLVDILLTSTVARPPVGVE